MSIKYIFSRIRRQTLSASFLPCFLFTLFLLIGIHYPFSQIFFPEKLLDIASLEEAYTSQTDYIVYDKITLHYTGYDCIRNKKTVGRYFYYIYKNKCVFFLLNSKDAFESENAITLENTRFSLVPTDQNCATLVTELSKDMDWSSTHLSESVADFIAVENPVAFYYSAVYAILLLGFTGFLFITLFTHLVILLFPKLQNGLFPKCSLKKRARMFHRLTHELSQDTLQVQCVSSDKRDFYLTDSFIINFSPYHTHIIPLKDIIWIYKHIPTTEQKRWDTPGKYTLHLLLKNGQHIPFKNYEETNANALIALLSTKNPDLLIGYSKEHLLLAKQYLSYIRSHN